MKSIKGSSKYKFNAKTLTLWWKDEQTNEWTDEQKSENYKPPYTSYVGGIKKYLGPVAQNLKFLANSTLKFLSWNKANTLIFLGEKNMSSFCIAKATHILQHKFQSIWKYLSYNS